MSQYTANQTQQPRTYQDRYRRGGTTLLDGMYQTGPFVVAGVSFVVALASILSFLVWDIISGAVTGEHFFTNTLYGWISSLATTGLTLSLIGTAMYGYKEGWSLWAVIPLAIVGLCPAAIDIYFDGIAVDILRTGMYIIPSQYFASTPAEIIPHQMFRVLNAFISAVGEPLSAGSVIIFPVLKELFKGIFA